MHAGQGSDSQKAGSACANPKLFPVFMNLADKKVLVVGAGEVAARKLRLLLGTGAQIHVGAMHFSEAVLALAQTTKPNEQHTSDPFDARQPEPRAAGTESRFTLHQGPYQTAWLNDAWLVIAATQDRALNERIAREAEQQRIPVNVVDTRELCTFQVPAMVERGDLRVAISSGGHAPVIARRIRERIETLLDPSLEALMALTERYRPAIRRARPSLPQRRQFYNWLLDGPVSHELRCGNLAQAEFALLQALKQAQAPARGIVTLVGAGPGDPGLLTLNAQRALNEADVILHDRLVGADILALARRDAQCICVGKKAGENQDATQNRIHTLMKHYAIQGLHVVRLKGGDPFIFGRGGEELQFLREHDIAWRVVPGLTAALAGAAYAGIPLTHRDHAQSVRLLTAHRRPGHDIENWPALTRPGQTLVFYMGVKQIGQLQTQLLQHGQPAHTAVAFIENATLKTQRVIHARVANMAAHARECNLQSPALIVVGDVVELGKELAWFKPVADPETLNLPVLCNSTP
jgi:uroporphyrin-III C-methyltransferase/precorrin-2 dehydrogenase/sirohydrochlorin ferrochelatase